MNTSSLNCHDNNVVDIFTGRSIASAQDRIVRVAPELDGLEMLYSNDSNPNKLYSMKVLAWAMNVRGEIVGLVPWLNDITACPDLRDPLNGHWEGYYDPGIDRVFYSPPAHKTVELETSAEYYEFQCEDELDIIQEIPDTIGTHAVFTHDGFQSFTLVEVVSWRLYHDGTLHGMIADDDKIESTPVLPGDTCLYPAQDSEGFKYFFQHRIANKIKSEDPEAMAAISLLMEP